MKKIIISLSILMSFAAIADEQVGVISDISSKIVGPSFGVEGQFSGALQWLKNDNGKGIKQITSNTNKYGKITVQFMPEWRARISSIADVVFGPTVNASFLTTINVKGEGDEAEPGFWGFDLGAGGEVDFDFKLPDAETRIYLGFDAGLLARGYIQGLFTKGSHGGVVPKYGISLGGKINKAVKVGLRAGVEHEFLYGGKESKYSEVNKTKFTYGITFGYLLN